MRRSWSSSSEVGAWFLSSDVGAAPWLERPVRCRRETVEIAMRDGVRLVADVYLPDGGDRWPFIVERTPYGARGLAALGECYAAHGYGFAAVDVRGRYRSEGRWEPLGCESRDGEDTLRWVLAHPACDGRLGTRGHSYSASNQFFVAPLLANAIKAMVSHAGPGDAFDNVPFHGGAYDLGDFLWGWEQTGPTSIDADDSEDDERPSSAAALRSRPFGDADIRLGLRVPHIRQWMRHWRLDDFWRTRSWAPGIATMPRAIPTLHVSGWWDTNGRGSVIGYRAFGGRSQRLLIGPWDHGMQPPALEALPEHEQALVARAALRDVFTDELQWFEQHLGGRGRALPSAEIFVTGAWRWVELDEWPRDPRHTVFWLGADGSLACHGDVPGGERRYRFDPAHPNPVSNPGLPLDLAPYDTSPDAREDVLVYRSAPLATGMLVLGDVHAELFASTTARDVDWVVRLSDEYPDGGSVYLRDGILRARFRHGFDAPEPVERGRVERYEIGLWHVGHLFRSGHRIRLEIASSAQDRWDVNPGDGEDLATSAAAVVSMQCVVHGRSTPSILRLPVIDSEQQRRLLWSP